MDLPSAISAAAEKTRTVASNVDASLLDGSTPCSDFSVADLAGHMSGFAPMSLAAATKSEFAPEEFDANTWRDRYLADLDKLPGAWASQGALDGPVMFGEGEMPAAQAASITVLELLVHGWDLAAATGQAYEADGELAQTVYGIVEAGRPSGTESGFFGPEVEMSDSASTWEKALALSGRNPAWTP